MEQHAIVIGAGFGGIAAALRLRHRGYRVTLIEQLDQLGGRATVRERNGFTFDMGPTVITAKFLFDELFELFGKKREDYVKFIDLYPWYRVQFSDGTSFDYGGTIEQTLEQIRKFAPDDCDGYLRFLEHSKRIFEVGFVELGDKPFDTLASMLRCAPQMIKLGAWRTVWGLASKYLKNEKLRRVFSFQPLLVGGNPFNTTSIYSLIHYLEREWGVQYAMGGTGAIVAALGKLMEEESIEIRLGTTLKEIEIKEGWSYRGELNKQTFIKPIATAVIMTSGERIPLYYEGHYWGAPYEFGEPVIVCNADAPFVYASFVGAQFRRKWRDKRLESLKYSMGLFVLYFGTTKQYPDVKHHTILLGDKYKQLLHEMFDLKQLELSDFSLYLHRPTATDPSMAPAGCDAWYVLCPVPNLQGNIDWKQMGPKYRDLIVAHLERVILPELSKHIVEDFFVTPEHFRDKLSTLHGTGFSIQPTFGQSAYFRFHNKSEDIANLYFVGAATHPGAGMPGVLCSAKVLERVLPPKRSLS
jgi:phytoene desaturase